MLSLASPYPFFTDKDGDPLDGGFVFVGEVAQNPETDPVTVYWDEAQTQPAAQPLRTLNGLIVRNGTPSRVYVAGDDFSLTVKDKRGVVLFYERSVAGIATLRAEFAQTSGAGLVGFSWALNYVANTIGWGVRTAPNATNILRYIDPAEWPALQAGTSNYDILAIFNTAKASNRALFFPADMTFKTSAPLVLDQEGFEMLGGSNATAIITQLAGFAGVATIDVNGARLQSIKSIRVHGNNAGGSDAIRVTNGPLTAIENAVVKFGTAGVRLISGNNQRWTNVFAESNATNFLVIPDAGDNTNGCTMTGLRSFNASSWGLDIQMGAGANGHMHSTWDISAEGGVNGIRVRGGRYCQFSLYSEANSGDEFDLDPAAAHSYFLKNPDADADGALFNIASFSMGTNGQGANLYFDRGIAPERHAEQAFAVSGSLAQVGVTMWDVTNISGSTRSITLSFLSYLPVGFKAMITKRDNTPGFTLLPPGGITLTGDTGTFGASVTSVAVLWVEKINSTTAILIQR